MIVTQSRAVYGQWEIVWLAAATTTMLIGETTSACSANKVSSHPRTLHSISLTDNHAHMLTGDKVTGPYMYACSVIVPPHTETPHYHRALLSHNVRRQQINLPPGSASFRGGAFLFCAVASRTCTTTNPVAQLAFSVLTLYLSENSEIRYEPHPQGGTIRNS